MTREIRFRAWIKDAPMCYEPSGMYYQESQYLSSFIRRIYDQYGTGHPSNLKFDLEERLMQYVGLNDKNDREIYEGDIVKDKNGNHEIIFRMGSFWAKKGDMQTPLCLWWSSAIEVIGNIYENQGLLSEK